MNSGASGAITGLSYYNIQQQLTAVSAQKEESEQKVTKLHEKMQSERYEDKGLIVLHEG